MSNSSKRKASSRPYVKSRKKKSSDNYDNSMIVAEEGFEYGVSPKEPSYSPGEIIRGVRVSSGFTQSYVKVAFK